jgi:cell division protein FtsB
VLEQSAFREKYSANALYRFYLEPPHASISGMKVDLGIWSKLTRFVLFLFFVAGILLVAVWYLPLIHTNERIRKENLRLDAQIRKQEESGKQMKVSIEALRFDPKAIERLARERLGYAKANETIVHFEDSSAPNSIRK